MCVCTLYLYDYFQVKKNVCRTIFKDTFNFMPMALAKLVPTFKLPIAEKPDFPHLANKMSNFGVRMPTLPPKSDYLAEAMMPEVRAKFDEFYEKNYNTEFFLDEKLAEYGCSDTGNHHLRVTDTHQTPRFRYTHACSGRIPIDLYEHYEGGSLFALRYDCLRGNALLADALPEALSRRHHTGRRLRTLLSTEWHCAQIPQMGGKTTRTSDPTS